MLPRSWSRGMGRDPFEGEGLHRRKLRGIGFLVTLPGGDLPAPAVFVEVARLSPARSPDSQDSGQGLLVQHAGPHGSRTGQPAKDMDGRYASLDGPYRVAALFQPCLEPFEQTEGHAAPGLSVAEKSDSCALDAGTPEEGAEEYQVVEVATPRILRPGGLGLGKCIRLCKPIGDLAGQFQVIVVGAGYHLISSGCGNL